MAQEGKSLIEEALTDAEQVRETALANAKAQLEEAFTPRIQSAISKGLKDSLEEETDGYDEDGEELNDPLEEEEEEEMYDDEDEDEEDDEELEEEMGDAEEDEDGAALPDPTNADDASLDEEEEEEYMDDEDEEERDLDLEAVIAELESEINEEETGYDDDGEKGKDPLDEPIQTEGEDMDDDEEEDDEDIVDLEELLNSLTEEEDEDMEDMEDEEEMEDTLDLEELFNSLEESDDSNEDLVETLTAENEKLTSENAEYREAVEILRSKLNEVNLLNAKLLYTSKLFKKYSLNNSQKMKVVESFDRTKSVRETKLVYSTLAESFQMGGKSKGSKRKSASLTEGLASKPIKSTKPTKDEEIIKESNNLQNRFKKLVNHNKKV